MPGVKRQVSPSSSEEDQLATPRKKTTSSKNAPKSPKSLKTPKSEAKTGGDGSKKTGAWSGDELRLLYGILNPKKTGVKWDEVAGQISGRDTKSCQNKWNRMQGKIMEAIEAMGE